MTVGLREKATGQSREKIVPERNVALRYKFEVQELLEREMKGFLEEIGVVANRRLASEIQEELDGSIEMYGVEEDKTQVEFDRVTINQDAVGGRVLYVVLTSELEIHKIPVTGHLHDIRQFGRVNREDFVSGIRNLLDEFNLSDDDKEKSVKECVRVMREEKLITR